MAKIKLLNRSDELQENKELGIALKLGRLLPEHIAEMRAMLATREDSSTSIAIYAMRHVISELINDGEAMDFVTASYRIDMLDKETQPFLLAVATLVIKATLVSDDVRKKSESQPKPGGQTSAAPDAQANAAPASADPQTNS